MHVAARARLVLARRPWIHWVVVAVLAGLAAAAVHSQIRAVAAERDRWGATRTVLVATRHHHPGDPVDAERTTLPVAALPDGALDELAGGAVVRQRVALGEVLTELDVTVHAGPAALAEPDTVVVGLSDPLARGVVVGLAVQVSADGLVLADDAVVTDVVDDVIFVAVGESDGPHVASAAQQGTASLLFVP